MNDRIARARGLVEQALRDVEAELAAPRTGLCPIQLGTCRDTLRELRRGAGERRLAPPEGPVRAALPPGRRRLAVRRPAGRHGAGGRAGLPDGLSGRPRCGRPPPPGTIRRPCGSCSSSPSSTAWCRPSARSPRRPSTTPSRGTWPTPTPTRATWATRGTSTAAGPPQHHCACCASQVVVVDARQRAAVSRRASPRVRPPCPGALVVAPRADAAVPPPHRLVAKTAAAAPAGRGSRSPCAPRTPAGLGPSGSPCRALATRSA